MSGAFSGLAFADVLASSSRRLASDELVSAGGGSFHECDVGRPPDGGTATKWCFVFAFGSRLPTGLLDCFLLAVFAKPGQGRLRFYSRVRTVLGLGGKAAKHTGAGVVALLAGLIVLDGVPAPILSHNNLTHLGVWFVFDTVCWFVAGSRKVIGVSSNIV